MTDGEIALERRTFTQEWNTDASDSASYRLFLDLEAAGRDGLPTGTYSVEAGTLSIELYELSPDGMLTGSHSAFSGSATVTLDAGGYVLELLDVQLRDTTSAAQAALTGYHTFEQLVYGIAVAAERGVVVGPPTFTVPPPAGLNNFHRYAWTGSRLWAATDLGYSWPTPQALVEIDPQSGAILQDLRRTEYESVFWNLNYANGALFDVFDFGDGSLARFDSTTGSAIAPFSYQGSYEPFYFLTYDGTNYWAGVNYLSGGGNSQTLVAYDEVGAVVGTVDGELPSDLVFGGGFFWAAQRDGSILKLDQQFLPVDTYQIVDYWRFGEALTAADIPIHLEFIDDRLWLMDRQNGFYVTSLQ